jgi:hypothetical protein
MNDHRPPPAPDPSDELLQGAMFYKGWACDSIAEARSRLVTLRSTIDHMKGGPTPDEPDETDQAIEHALEHLDQAMATVGAVEIPGLQP